MSTGNSINTLTRVETYFGEDQPAAKYLGLWLTIFILWAVFYPYHGLIHDSRLYTLLALNNLHPDLYGNDIFLRFGSQDKYTLFSPLYGFFIKLLGIEPAAALLTFISHISLFSAIWLLARQFMSAGLATFALGLVIAVPGFYGSDYTFYFLETFLTPRTLAEALVLFALTAQLRKHYLLTGVLLLFSLVTHPLISLAGLAST